MAEVNLHNMLPDLEYYCLRVGEDATYGLLYEAVNLTTGVIEIRTPSFLQCAQAIQKAEILWKEYLRDLSPLDLPEEKKVIV